MLDDRFRIRYKSIPIAISEGKYVVSVKLHNHCEFEILLVNSGSSVIRIARES